MIKVDITPNTGTGYTWTARDGATGPILAQGADCKSDLDATEIVKRLFATFEPVEVAVRWRNGTGRHEMIR